MLVRTGVLAIAAAAVVATAAPASADFKVERRLALQAGGTFTLDADSGAVTITGDSTSGVVVTVTAARDDFQDRYDLQFDERPGAATVTLKRRGGLVSGWFGIWGDWDSRVQFTVHVPRAAAVEVRTSGGSVHASGLAAGARVRSSGGSLTLEDLAGDLDARTSGGSLRVRQVRGRVAIGTSGGSIDVTDVRGDLQANTSGGAVRIDNVSGDVDASTSGGIVQVRGAGGHVRAHTSGGPITIGFAEGNNRGGEISTSGGGVRAEIDPAIALSIDASTSGGNVVSDLPVTVRGRIERNALRGDLNGGGAVLRLRSSGGGIRISSIRATAASR